MGSSEEFQCLHSTPIEWETPNGQIARVNLQLQFSAFFGYGQADAQPGYLGLQCHGLLWPVMDADLPHYWPIAPPVVSGKVRGMELTPRNTRAASMQGWGYNACG